MRRYGNSAPSPCRRVWLLAAAVSLAGCTALPLQKDPPCDGDWPMSKNTAKWTILVTQFTTEDVGLPLDPRIAGLTADQETAPPAPDRRKRAEDLVRRLRCEYKLDAYWEHDAAKLMAEWAPHQAEALPPTSAVFVGAFEDRHSPEARRTLARVEEIVAKLPPSDIPTKALFAHPSIPADRRAITLFVLNPRAPASARERLTRDDFPSAINDCPYSLLNLCKARYTLVVLKYSGGNVIALPGTSSAELQQKPIPSLLEQAERAANLVTAHLRKLGHEAYVLHARRHSYVTVGSYNDPKDPRIEYDMARYKDMELVLPPPAPGRKNIVVKLRKPALMEVPQ